MSYMYELRRQPNTRERDSLTTLTSDIPKYRFEIRLHRWRSRS